jgi:Spy/CpxP family protein refolding chaperone
MMTILATRFACWVALVSMVAASADAKRPVAGKTGKPTVEKSASRTSHRLPAHYAQVVTQKQREQIYKIQDEYQPEIETLQKQLNALKQERDRKIVALLTAEQRKQIEEAAAAAKAKRKSKGRESPLPAEKAPIATVESTPPPAKATGK